MIAAQRRSKVMRARRSFREARSMRKDERQLFDAMLELVQGKDAGAASNAAMNLLAALIVMVSPTWEQAESGADYAASEIKEFTREHWNKMGGKSPPGHG